MSTHSSMLAWEISWTEEPDGLYSPWGRKESDTTERLTSGTSLFVCLFSTVYFILEYSWQTMLLVSGAQQSSLTIRMHWSSPLQVPLSSRLLHNTEHHSLCYTACPWNRRYFATASGKYNLPYTVFKYTWLKQKSIYIYIYIYIYPLTVDKHLVYF